jgi:hypothetical protein
MKTRAVVAVIAVLVMAEALVPQTAGAWWRRWGDPMLMAPAAGGMYGPRPAYPPYPGGGYAMPGGYGAPPPAYPHPGYGYGVAGYSQPAAPPPYQQPYAYPQRGQSPEQSSDEFRACQTWASTQTGYNPSAPAATAAAPQTASAGASLVRGGARGAAVGAVGGAIGGDAGKGAAVGAAVGGMFSLMRRREEQQALEREEQAAAQGTIQKADAYNRALDACMSGRGYTVR